MVGTQKQNLMDMTERGRRARGAQHGRVKLTEGEVRSIRALRPEHTLQELANMFGVGPTAISKIVNNVHWKHI